MAADNDIVERLQEEYARCVSLACGTGNSLVAGRERRLAAAFGDAAAEIVRLRGEVELLHVIHTRLVRCLPHLADVIALCIWPEYMPLPDWVAVGGEPRPALYPAAAAARVYRS